MLECAKIISGLSETPSVWGLGRNRSRNFYPAQAPAPQFLNLLFFSEPRIVSYIFFFFYSNFKKRTLKYD